MSALPVLKLLQMLSIALSFGGCFCPVYGYLGYIYDRFVTDNAPIFNTKT